MDWKGQKRTPVRYILGAVTIRSLLTDILSLLTGYNLRLAEKFFIEIPAGAPVGSKGRSGFLVERSPLKFDNRDRTTQTDLNRLERIVADPVSAHLGIIR